MKKVVSKCLHYLEVLGEYAIQKYGLEYKTNLFSVKGYP